MATVLKWLGYGVMGIGLIPFLFIQSVVEEMEQKYDKTKRCGEQQKSSKDDTHPYPDESSGE
ncbi:hypothetical protein ABEV00_07780 [Paenibacillus thiaminolyticus]|uniref:hypothetical protein n=1 Tax=Paenibacillus TaxID=44249 RepID=UPI00105AACBC|nr:hypothetical protein [Paenibacillus dendritiformis]TDL53787.1 hypothetical protein E2R60_12100 [Paenibacillus dendritiformis]